MRDDGHIEPPLHTPRLQLVPVTQAMRLAFGDSRAAFAACTGLTLPAQWPAFPSAFTPRPATAPPPHAEGWPGYLFVLRGEAQLVGNGGFVAPPDALGEVEIGYEVAPAHGGQGYATEAAQALVSHAFAFGAQAVLAHTADGANASNGVLAKLGMQLTARLPHPRRATMDP